MQARGIQYYHSTEYSRNIHEKVLCNGGNTHVNERVLQNKKGFTLVELMIVVVIMGVLVAVAIPIFNSVTKGVEANACHANCEIIEKAAQQYLLDVGHETVESITGNSGSVTITSPEDASAKLPADFLKCFKNNEFPQCPSDDCTYVIYSDVANGDMTVSVYCSTHGNLNGNPHE